MLVVLYSPCYNIITKKKKRKKESHTTRKVEGIVKAFGIFFSSDEKKK
jgi:hypothetical protein